VIEENLIRYSLIDNGSEVNVYALIVVISIDCKIGNFVINVRVVVGFEAVNFCGIGNSGASCEVSGVFRVLSVKVDLCVIKGIELLSTDEGVSVNCGRFVPPSDKSIILL